jgi:hypothetical protein
MLTISVLAVADSVDAQCTIRFFGEANTIVADSKAQLTGVSLKLFDVPFSGLGESMKCGKDTHGRVAIEAADISPRTFGPGDFPHA